MSDCVCFWKGVEQHDAPSERVHTFGLESKCHPCDGQNMACAQYIPSDLVRERLPRTYAVIESYKRTGEVR